MHKRMRAGSLRARVTDVKGSGEAAENVLLPSDEILRPFVGAFTGAVGSFWCMITLGFMCQDYACSKELILFITIHKSNRTCLGHHVYVHPTLPGCTSDCLGVQ